MPEPEQKTRVARRVDPHGNQWFFVVSGDRSPVSADPVPVPHSSGTAYLPPRPAIEVYAVPLRQRWRAWWRQGRRRALG